MEGGKDCAGIDWAHSVRVLKKLPGRKLQEAFMDFWKVKPMMQWRCLTLFSDIAVLDEGEGEPNGSVLGMPLHGLVVITGIGNRDGATVPMSLGRSVTYATAERLFPGLW